MKIKEANAGLEWQIRIQTRVILAVGALVACADILPLVMR